MPTNERPPATRTLKALLEGEIELQGRMPWSSNSTFLVTPSVYTTNLQMTLNQPLMGSAPMPGQSA